MGQICFLPYIEDSLPRVYSALRLSGDIHVSTKEGSGQNQSGLQGHAETTFHHSVRVIFRLTATVQAILPAPLCYHHIQAPYQTWCAASGNGAFRRASHCLQSTSQKSTTQQRMWNPEPFIPQPNGSCFLQCSGGSSKNEEREKLTIDSSPSMAITNLVPFPS